MRVLLKNGKSGLYYSSPSSWVSKPDEALDFMGTGQALQTIQDLRLRGAYVVLSFGRPQDDVILPLGIQMPVAATNAQSWLAR